MKVYVASSWRNEQRQQATVAALRAVGHEVYDFRNPAHGDHGFSWKQCATEGLLGDPLTDPRVFRDHVLTHPVAKAGFFKDMTALQEAEACVLVLPCGRSAHLELGWSAGAGRRTIVVLDDPMSEPELMYLMNTQICLTIDDAVEALSKRFWEIEDGSALYWVVARDREDAIAMMNTSGIEFGDHGDKGPARFLEAMSRGDVLMAEVSFARAVSKRCDTRGDERGRGTITLPQCDMGEWFSSEY